ncbi:ABC transporter permease [Streptacidiphilus rugosus]|uniref:ABC transporter permease n=1 Tax=Streptacidiphilus rugosus TaxID=405783 RepID=UPI00068F5ADD|nr:ABC transporter permease [Streptacidiphilus rugosus]
MNARLRPYLLVVLLPLVAVALLWAFVWPAARTAPRELPLGLVGPDRAVVQVEQGLEVHAGPHAFAVHRYADLAAARTAVADRQVYGAIVLAPEGTRMLTASAASPAVATLLQQVAHQAPGGATVTDVVPLPSGDPRGSVFASSVLPMAIAGLALGAVTFLFGRGVGQRLLMLLLSAAAVGAAAVTVSQGWLGALEGNAAANAGVVALMVLAVSSVVCGLAIRLGAKGIGLGALVLMLLGNAWSGVMSAPELLPGFASWAGRLLPVGAGATALRDAAFFGGHRIGFPLLVLAAWIVAGLGLTALAARAGTGSGSKAVASAEDASVAPRRGDEAAEAGREGRPAVV